jgi:hypothetical protein
MAGMKTAFFLLMLSTAACSAAGTADAAAWALPVSTPAAQPSLSLSPDGGLNLSWIERTTAGHRLRFSRYRNGRWSAPATVAAGNDWFVNWADFPSTTQLPDGTLWAHNLVKRGAGTYAYDLVLYRSTDNGRSWSNPQTVHDDGTETEHGFASLWPWSASELAVAWLDGRATAGDSGHDDSHHQPGADDAKAMTLRAAVFDADGKRVREWPLDARTCDCCQTDAALTSKGPVLIYRDRSPDEIRDVYSIRFQGGQWRKPQPVAEDGWRMPACPVNGPAIAAVDDSVWAAWYTAPEETPSLRIAFSDNAGTSFTHTRSFRSGASMQGRVDLAANADGAWMVWMEEGTSQSLWLARLDRQLQTVGPPVLVATLQGRGRATGFARMQAVGRTVYVVWTDVVDGKPELQGAQFRF